MTDKEKTKFITDTLFNKYARVENTFAFKELCVQNELCQWKRIDLYVINEYPSKQFYAKSFEIKVSKADFKNDFKKDNKQDMAIKYSNEFFYVTPPKLIKKEDLPEYAGLIEVDDNGNCKIIQKAPKREKSVCDWYFYILSLKNKTKQEMEQQRILNFDNSERQHLKNSIHNKEKEIKQLNQLNKMMQELLKQSCSMINYDDLPAELKIFHDVKNLQNN